MQSIRVHGYVRVSSREQNEGRQINALVQYGISERDIYVDKASGKSFDRPEYQRLLNVIRKGDLVVVLSIDRLGRDYSEVQKQWAYITSELGANIKVLDMPLLDTSKNSQSLDNRFIADLVLQILSYVANKEREQIKKRQREGIDLMPIVKGVKISTRTGRAMGRPRVQKPDNWNIVYSEWKAKKITAIKAMEILELKTNTFYKLVQECKNENKG